jgi:hypothetical protein
MEGNLAEEEVSAMMNPPARDEFPACRWPHRFCAGDAPELPVPRPSGEMPVAHRFHQALCVAQ